MLIGTPSVSRLPGTWHFSDIRPAVQIYRSMSNNNLLKKFFGTKCRAKLKWVSSFIQDIVFPKLAKQRNMRWPLFIAIFWIALQTCIDMIHTICNLPTPENKPLESEDLYLGKGKTSAKQQFWGFHGVFDVMETLSNAYTYVRKLHCPKKNLAPPYKPKQYHQAVLTTNFRHTVHLLKNSIHFLLTQLPTGPTGCEPPPNPLCICRFIPFLSQQQLQGCDLKKIFGGKGT